MYKKHLEKKKKTHQITDQTREEPPTTRGGSIKEREALSKDEERKDYPEVSPSAMSNFICNKCGTISKSKRSNTA